MIKVEFKDKTNETYRLIVTHLTRRKRAEEHIEQFTIEGRSGRIVDRLGTYDSYVREVEFANMEPDRPNQVNKWLSGKGILRTSEDPGGFFYADVIDLADREYLGCKRNQIKAKFLIEPFFYFNKGEHKVMATTTKTLNNIGTIYSEPTITVYGTGNGEISINNKIIRLENINGHIVINSRLKIAHKDKLPQGQKMKGDFPVFEEGESTITFNGGITKLEIQPYWREL